MTEKTPSPNEVPLHVIPSEVEGSRRPDQRDPVQTSRANASPCRDLSTSRLRRFAQGDSRSIRRSAPAVRSHPGRI